MILIDIFNAKQAVSTLGRYLSCLPSIEVEDSAHTRIQGYNTDAICMRVNVVGARRRGSVALMLGYRRQW